MTDLLTKGEQTRQDILYAAKSLFTKQGFHGTSMRQIASDTGITVGSIYNHFENKEQIFDHVLIEQHPYRRIIAILESTPISNVEEFMIEFVGAVINEMGNNPDFFELVFIELSEFKGKHVPQLLQAILPHTLPVIERLKATQMEMRDLPSHTILLSFVGLFFGYYLADIITNSDEKMKKYRVDLEQYLTIYLHGILKTEQS